jgi:pSer/pThr/pTyr-binding forkhead associated (FHA) protein
MVELHVLTGRQAGGVLSADTFPCLLGRAPAAHLRLDDPGVWDRHLEIELLPGEGFHARLQPPALATLNGAPLADAPLRNGDELELGSVRLRFWLRPARQQTFVVREVLTWLGLALLCLVQAALILWLTH